MRSPHFSDESNQDAAGRSDDLRKAHSPDRSSRPQEERKYDRHRDDDELPSRSNRDRDRSRSPPRQSTSISAPVPAKPKQDFSKGFKWKSKPRNSGEEKRTDFRDKYRDRDPEYQPRRYGGKSDGERFVERNRERDDRERDFRERNRDRDRRRDRDHGRSYHDDSYRRGRDRRDDYDDRRNEDRDSGRRDDNRKRGDDKPQKERKPTAPAQSTVGASKEYIVVTVNDRLGTKARIPCLPSDTVGDFKKLVAAHIGRQPHEIMLKRQSQRPFKDTLTLEDYEVSNGVQLDLELDTGD